MEAMAQYLKWLEDLRACGGHCFHGSKQEHSIVEPRPARCNSGRVEGCQHAVYATEDDIAVAIVMALFDRLSNECPASFSYSRHDKGPLVVKGENATFTPGFVHVLSSKSFEHFGDEYISYEPVKVLSVFPVDPSILRLLTNIELHIPIPPPY